MSVSFEEIGQVLVTCRAAAGVAEGDVVKVSENSTVAACAAGERFCGQAVSAAADGFAAVQVKGFITVACEDSTVTPGWVELTADGNGGVKKAGSDDSATEVLVMDVEDDTVVLCL